MPSGLMPVLWIHDRQALSSHPALEKYPGVPALFVLDQDLLLSQGIALSEISDLYQQLIELPVTLREGEAVAEIRAFADEYGANQVITTDSPYACIQHVIRELKAGLMVRVLR